MNLLHTFFQAFFPLFVTIDAFGLVPLFLGVTESMSPQRRQYVCFQAVGSAMFITILFMLLGNQLFHFLAITEDDFRIAGGVILLVLAVLDLLIRGKPAVHEDEIVGLVPLAMPLIAGPATLTTVLVLSSNPEFGYGWTAMSLCVNFVILLAVLSSATYLARLIGMNTLRAFSKLVMVLLAAIAVNFIRVGIGNLIRGRSL